jgi:glycosyltransferase involved in cell wall biosynthesis
MVGDGPDRQRLERAADGLGDRIRFLGHQANAWPFYFIADVFVLPSHSEGSPLVLFEAMAAERAIVATAVGGVPETVEDGVSAVLVPPRDIGRLKVALGSLCADRDRRTRLAQAAFGALQKYSPEAYRDRILALYREATSAP